MNKHEDEERDKDRQWNNVYRVVLRSPSRYSVLAAGEYLHLETLFFLSRTCGLKIYCIFIMAVITLHIGVLGHHKNNRHVRIVCLVCYSRVLYAHSHVKKIAVIDFPANKQSFINKRRRI